MGSIVQLNLISGHEELLVHDGHDALEYRVIKKDQWACADRTLVLSLA